MTIQPGTLIHDLPATVVSLEDASSRFGKDRKLIRLRSADGQNLLWFRTRPTTLSAGDEIVLAEAFAKKSLKSGTTLTHVCLQDPSPLRP